MFALFCFVLAVLTSLFKSKSRLEAENAALRHQLIVLRRKVHGRVRLTNIDRWFFIQSASMVSVDCAGRYDHQASNHRAVASGWLSLLLALEVASAGRAAADRGGPPRTDPADEH